MSIGGNRWNTNDKQPYKDTEWAVIPLWVMKGGAVPKPGGKFLLPNGEIVRPGEWIIETIDGLVKESGSNG